MTAPEGKKISWSTGRGQFARQSFLSSNQGRAKHVETCGESHQDRGSTPLASTSLIINDLRRQQGPCKTPTKTLSAEIRVLP